MNGATQDRRRWGRRKIGGVTAAGLLFLCGLLLLWVGLPGSTFVERWVGGYALGLAESSLDGTLSADRIDYRFPLKVRLEGLTLRAADDTGHGGDELLRVQSATVSLRRLPMLGGPVPLRRVEIVGPVLTVAGDADGALIGWPTLIKPAPPDAPASPPLAFLDAVTFDDVAVTGGTVRLIARPGAEPVSLPFRAAATRAQVGGGAHGVTLDADLAGLIRVDGRGTLEPTTSSIALDGLTLQLTASPDPADPLDAALQRALGATGLAGRAAITVSGSIDLDGPTFGTGSVEVRLDGVGLRRDGRGVTLAPARFAARWHDRQLSVEPVTLTLDNVADAPRLTLDGLHLDNTGVQLAGVALHAAGAGVFDEGPDATVAGLDGATLSIERDAGGAVERIALRIDRPRVSAWHDEAGRLAGVAPLLDALDDLAAALSPSDAAATARVEITASERNDASDADAPAASPLAFLRGVSSVDVVAADAALRYHPPGEAPTVGLTGLTLTARLDGAPTGPLPFRITLTENPLITLRAGGAIEPEAGTVTLDPSEASLDLTARGRAGLPAAARDYLAKVGVSARLTARGQGSIDTADLAASRFDGMVSVQDVTLPHGGYLRRLGDTRVGLRFDGEALSLHDLSVALPDFPGRPALRVGAVSFAPPVWLIKGATLTVTPAQTPVVFGERLPQTGPVDLLTLERGEFTPAAALPVGRTVGFDVIKLVRPRVALVALPTGPGFLGVREVLEALAAEEDVVQERRERIAGELAAPVSPLSFLELLALRKLELVEAEVVYRPADAAKPPLVLDRVDATLDLTPDAEEKFAYAFDVARSPQLSGGASGTLDIGTGQIGIDALTLEMQLDGAADSSLPPDLQQLLRRLRLRGRYFLTLAGTVATINPASSLINGAVEVDDAYLTHANWTYPMQSLRASFHTQHDTFTVSHLAARVFQGELTLTGQARLDPEAKAIARLKANNLRIEQLVPDHLGVPIPRYRGTLTADLTWDGSLTYWNIDARGNGSFHLADARLVDVPLLTEMGDLFNELVGNRREGRDDVQGRFEFKRTLVHVTSLRATSGPMALIGEGKVHFDGRVNFLVNAGPFERLAGLFGADGIPVLSAVLPKYRMSGTLARPLVTTASANALLDD